MALTFQIETQTDYLLMIYHGAYDSSLADEFTDQILNACKTHKPARLLIDLRKVKGNMTTMDRFNLSVIAAAKYLGAKLTGKIPSCRYAIVGNHPLVDPGKFEETVAINRGINVRTFTSMDHAVSWLEIGLP